MDKISGRRLLPFYSTEWDVVNRSIIDAFLFDAVPNAQLIGLDTETITDLKLVEAATGIESAITLTPTDFSYKGVDYKAFTSNNTGTFSGQYYFKVTHQGNTLRTDVFRITGCDTWKITYKHDCDHPELGVGGFLNTFHVRTMRPLPNGIDEFREGVEDGYGKDQTEYLQRRTLYRFEMAISPRMLDRMQYLDMFSEVKLTNGNITYDIDPRSIAITNEEPTEEGFVATFEFSIVDSDVISEDCACEVPVPTNPNGIDCSLINISIDQSNLPTLGFTHNYPATESLNASWYKDDQFVTSANTVSATLGSKWEVRVWSLACGEKSASIFLPDVCENFDLTLQQIGSAIIGSPTGVPAGATLQVEVRKDADPTIIATALPYDATPTGAGVYTVRYTTTGAAICGPKEVTAFIDPTVDQSPFSVEVVRTGGVLSGVVTGPIGPNPTYQWLQVDENGNETPVSTDPTFTPTDTANYVLVVSDGGDSARDDRLFISNENQVIVNLGEYEYEFFSLAKGNLTTGNNYVDVTVETLPNMATIGVEEWRKKVQIFSNQGLMNPTDAAVSPDYSWVRQDTNNNQRILFHDGLDDFTIIHIWFQK